ncbi:RNA-binding protein [[Clostridium] sordellii]|uniref:S1 RNA-binding domain-containing protein n=1 Tax=Paraclostridium sordellii TaxID=1505 RepID=A0ABM9RSW8_PARSO|nr:Tex family protein [Paeniclostridium sordellii]CEJ75190.1 putative S1 RNA-binding domain-containing protein [[Clostridium] sordellii] [Paeniclostridium sordellii]CEN70959.1 RNA-binding protein [[Clostridium] sordellii] [Paeniclostridium sordellii]CEN74250.1 RNA-binding protein [[Clostridium] sordellii] [Paeniclostridium sordellii]CEO30430.1 RNA-binding protein [[Clostridium] sordellii] [Paeniclostridium sordellii]CEP65830.1 RNA-binding protein [[Clostridium] sordellii] [Paeniclostridium sor
MDINQILKSEFNLRDSQIENTIKLIDEGNTIPFIARYRKEMTGEMSDVTLRAFHEKLTYLRNLQSRKDDVQRIIQEQGKLNKEIEKSIEQAKTLQEVEDIYAPFKQKKRTRATIAKEKGLEPLAMAILNENINLKIEIPKYIDEEKEVNSEEDALKGAKDIIAEIVSEDAKLRKYIRELALKEGVINSKSTKDEKSVYDMYYDYSEGVKHMAPHRVLAINRGEKEEFLKVKLEINNDKVVNYIFNTYINKNNKNNEEEIKLSIEDAYKRLIFPSIEREIRNHLTEMAHERAISVFGQNVKSLLLQPPVRDKVVMGFDPAYRTGCKIAVVDKNGKLLDYTTVYPTKPQNDVDKAKKTLKDLIEKYDIDIISIGNGTASRESEQFVSEMIKEINRDVQYTIVSEAGASVYSASELANEEHPDINVSIRGAISIARRLQDPLAELVKIDPKSIGVGQYQHDLNKKRLEEVLSGVVEDAVNSVGVDLNTASYSLLEHVAGINKTIAKNIIEYREENGDFTSRAQIKKVKRLGPQAFTQCAGFLRIVNSKNPLDNTSVHPETYDVCKKLLEKLGCSLEDIKNKNINDIDDKVSSIGIDSLSKELEVGIVTLKDIISEIKKPGRDPREEGIKPVLRTDVLKIEDIKEDMILKGTVRNVVDFGAFVDIGIKNDGLVHKSQMSNKYVKDPMTIVTVGDVIDVKVIGIDLKTQKVSLTMKDIK